MQYSPVASPIVYPQLPKNIDSDDIETFFALSQQDKEWVKSLTYSGDTRIAFLCLLGGFQSLGYFPDLSDLSPRVIKHIAEAADANPPLLLLLNKRTLYRHHRKIRRYLGVSAWNKESRHKALESMKKTVVTRSNLTDLINATIESLIQTGIELPALSTLRRMAGSVLQNYHNQLFHQINHCFFEDQRTALNAILEGSPQSPFARLCQPIGKLARKNVKEAIDRFEWLDALLPTGISLKHIPATQLEQWADEAGRLDADELKEYRQERRLSYLICLIYVSKANLLDALTTLFLKIVRRIKRLAVDRLNAWVSGQQQSREQLLILFREVLKDIKAEQNPELCQTRITERLERVGGIDEVLQSCEARLAYQSRDWRAFSPKAFSSQRATLLTIAAVLRPKSTDTQSDLLEALSWILDLRADRSAWVRLDLPHSFLPPAWRVHVCDEASPGIYHRRFLEIALLFELAAGFRSASLYVENSTSFADYRKQFLPLESDNIALNEYLLERGLPEKAENFVADLKQDLSRACHALEQNVYKNKSIQLDANGQPIVPRPLAISSPPSLQKLEESLKRRLPQRDVLEALYHADQLTGWSKHFRPPARIRSQIDRPVTRSVLTAFTYGCGLGPTQAARHFDCETSAKQLRFVNRRHVGVPELRAACTDIIDQYAKYDLPSCWGSGESAAADGSLIATYTNNLNAQYHVRYQRVGGIAYRHVADNYIALFSQFIGCGVREAVYILDGVLNNTSSVNPQRLHADTHGQSEAVFGLAFLLGIELMPRIRNWRSLHFYSHCSPENLIQTQHLYARTIDWDRIEAHWQDYLKLVMAIRTGRLTPSAILTQLNSYSRQNPVYRSLQELGRVIRTIYLLDWIQDDELRAGVTQGANKVESYHAFSQHLNFGNNGIAKTNDPIEQEKMTVYNQLVCNAVMLQNVADQTRALHDLHAEGQSVSNEELARLSPYLTHNLKRFGTYRTTAPGDAMPVELKLP